MKLNRPFKEETSKGSVLWKICKWCGFLGGLFVICLVVAYYILVNYVTGDECRHQLEQSLSRVTGAETKISPLRKQGSSVSVGSVQLKGGEVERVFAKDFDIKFDFHKLWDRVVYADSISLESLTIVLPREEKNNEEEVQAEIIEEDSSLNMDSEVPIVKEPEIALLDKPHTERKSEEGFFTKMLPNRFAFDSMEIENFNLSRENKQGLAYLKNAAARLVQDPTQPDLFRLSLSGGDVAYPLGIFAQGALESGVLESASLAYQRQAVTIDELKVNLYPSGRLAAEGSWGGNSDHELSVSVQNVGLESVLPKDWCKYVKGEVGAVSVIKKGKNGVICEGDAEAKNTSITALPFLDTLSVFSGGAKFRTIPVTQAKMKFRYEKNRWVFYDIFLASEGLVRIEGTVTVEGEKLSGELMVGVPAGVMGAVPGVEGHLFSSQTNGGKLGLLWTPVKLSGTVKSPKEDLSKRLLAMVGSTLLNSLSKGKNDTLEALKNVMQGGDKSSDENSLEEKSNKKPLKVGEELLNSVLDLF